MDFNSHIVAGLTKIGTFLRSEQRQQAEATGLTLTQAQILVHLAVRGPAPVSAVADEIAVTQPTVSDAVAALVRKGRVAKRDDPDDGRVTQLHTTAKGERDAAALGVWPDALLGAFDALDGTEQAVFLKGLTKMIRELQVRGAIPVQRMCATCRFFRPNTYDDSVAPHHCDFVDAAFGDGALRLDCGEHEEASSEDAAAAWKRFTEE